MFILVPYLFLFSLIAAKKDPLEGSWVSLSKTVVTGPGFFDPIDELLIEPALPGICYSFDGEGHWEQAIYQVYPNAVNHSQTTAALLWQHGTYQIKHHKKTNTYELKLKPIEVDGRRLFTDEMKTSTYMRYKQKEVMQNFVIEFDKYYGKHKLTLYQWDGSKMQPLWLEYRPPMMLPTTVLNPTNKAQAKSVKKERDNLKRSIHNRDRTSAKRRADIYDYIAGSVVFALTSVSLVWLVRLARSVVSP